MPNHLPSWKLASATLILCLGCPLSFTNKTGNLDALAQAPVSSGASQRDEDRSTPNRQIEAAKLFQIGTGQLQNNQLPAALETFQQVLAIRREIGDKEGERETLLKLAEVYQKQGQNDRAIEYVRQAEAIIPSTGSASAIAQTPQRDDESAIDRHLVVQATAQRDDDRLPTPTPPAQPTSQIAQTPQRDDDKQPTASSIQRSPAQAIAQTSQRDDDKQPTASSIQGSQYLYRQLAQTFQRDDDSSRPILSAQTGAGAIAQTPQRDDDSSRIALTSDRKSEADRLFQTGVQQLQTNQLQTALTTFQQVATIRQELNDKMGVGQALFQIAKVYDLLKQPQQAQNYYRQARELGVQ